jgi:multidrug efflux pump subunit AcrA (membrane-fusion protein)
VKVYLDAYPERTYRGKVDRVWPTANRQKATVEVRVALLGLDEKQRIDLRPEMGVRVVFLAADGAPEAAPQAAGPAPLLVPAGALTTLDGRPGVFVFDRGEVHFRVVETAPGSGGGARVPVTSGLQAGERVVVDPPSGLADGDRVLVVEG